MRKSSKYTPDEALKLGLKNLRKTRPSADVVKVIEEIEKEASQPIRRSEGERRRRQAV